MISRYLKKLEEVKKEVESGFPNFSFSFKILCNGTGYQAFSIHCFGNVEYDDLKNTFDNINKLYAGNEKETFKVQVFINNNEHLYLPGLIIEDDKKK